MNRELKVPTYTISQIRKLARQAANDMGYVSIATSDISHLRNNLHKIKRLNAIQWKNKPNKYFYQSKKGTGKFYVDPYSGLIRTAKEFAFIIGYHMLYSKYLNFSVGYNGDILLPLDLSKDTRNNMRRSVILFQRELRYEGKEFKRIYKENIRKANCFSDALHLTFISYLQAFKHEPNSYSLLKRFEDLKIQRPYASRIDLDISNFDNRTSFMITQWIAKRVIAPVVKLKRLGTEDLTINFFSKSHFTISNNNGMIYESKDPKKTQKMILQIIDLPAENNKDS